MTDLFIKKLLEIENSYFLQQVVAKSTRLNNTLDFFFTNNESLINRVKPLPGISDHVKVKVVPYSLNERWVHAGRAALFPELRYNGEGWSVPFSAACTFA